MRIGKLVITRNKSYESKFRFYRSEKGEKSSFVWAFLLGPIVFIWIKLGLSDRARNWPCPCGSGRKFKKCCQPNIYAYVAAQGRRSRRRRMRRDSNRGAKGR